MNCFGFLIICISNLIYWKESHACGWCPSTAWLVQGRKGMLWGCPSEQASCPKAEFELLCQSDNSGLMLKNYCLRALFKTESSDLAVVEERCVKPFCLLSCLEVACSGHRLSYRSWAACRASALLLALLLHWEEQTCKLAALCQVTACFSSAWAWFGVLSLPVRRYQASQVLH